MSLRWGASCSRPTDTGMQVSHVLCCCHGLVCHVLSLRCLAVFWHHILWTFHLPWYFHMVLKMWVHADELKVMKWGEKLQTRPVVFILRHHGEHRLLLRRFHLSQSCQKEIDEDHSQGTWGQTDDQNPWNSHKVTQLESSGWNLNPGVTPEAAPNLQCAVTTCVHLTDCHRFRIWGNWTISEVNSFFLSVDVYFAYSVPGTALDTGITATNKTEVSEIVALWTDEKISPHRSPDIFVGTWVNYFHKSMSGVNTANLSCKSQCFNH